MFASVIPFTGCGGGGEGGMHGRGNGVCGRRDGHCSGRYTFYRNTFLLNIMQSFQNEVATNCQCCMHPIYKNYLFPNVIEHIMLAMVLWISSEGSNGWPFLLRNCSARAMASSWILSSSDCLPKPKSLIL